MAMKLMSTAETPEEAELRRRKATAFRIKVLGISAVLAVGARLLISNPPPRAQIDYTKGQNVRIVPGMLNTMPASARAKLDPDLINKMILADERARRGKTESSVAVADASGAYRVADAPSDIDIEAASFKESAYAYDKRRQMDRQRALLEQHVEKTGKDVLVNFTSGGYVFAESAKPLGRETAIRIDRTMEANLPSRWVASIRSDAAEWKEPLPAGQVRLKPAKGITVILHKDAASRVTMSKGAVNDI